VLPIFSSFDSEGDGFAQVDEVRDFLTGSEGPGLGEKEAYDLLRRCGGHKKGQLGQVRVRDLVENFVLCLTGRGGEESASRPQWCTLQEEARFSESVMWELMERWYARCY